MVRLGQLTRRAIGKASARKYSKFAKRTQSESGWADIPTEAGRRAFWHPKRPGWWMVFCCFPIHCTRLEKRRNCEPPIFPSYRRPSFLSTVRATHLDRSRNYDRPLL